MSWQGKCGRIKTTCWGEKYWKWGDQKRVRRLTKSYIVLSVSLSCLQRFLDFLGFLADPKVIFWNFKKFLSTVWLFWDFTNGVIFKSLRKLILYYQNLSPLPKVDRILKLLSNTRKYFNQLLLTICSGHSKEIHSTDKRRKSM